MNELNYCSREYAQKLIDNGIVLETGAVWFESLGGWMLTDKENRYDDFIPAPSMAEVWRELPTFSIDKMSDGRASCWCPLSENKHENINPTDALIDLLIWVRKEKVCI